MTFSDQALQGRNVISADGLSVGSVVALFIDIDEWRVESLQVTLHKDVADRIGAGRSWLHKGVVEIPTRMVQSVGDAVVLSVRVDELRKVLPEKAESTSPPT